MMGKLAWINYVDTATLLNVSQWQSARPISEVKKPRLKGLARSVGSTPSIDLDFGAVREIGIVALIGLSPCLFPESSGSSVIVSMSSAAIGFADRYYDAYQPLIAEGTAVSPNVFIPLPSPVFARFVRITLNPDVLAIPNWSVRRVWVGPTLDVDVGDGFAIGGADRSKVEVTEDEVPFVSRRKVKRVLSFSTPQMSGQAAYGYSSATLLCVAEMDLAAGNSGEVIVVPLLEGPPGADPRRVVGMSTIYGLFTSRDKITKTDAFFNWAAEVAEIPSGF